MAEEPIRRTCGTMEGHRRLLEVDSGYRARRLALEARALAYTRLAARRGPREEIATIPVVVHVLYGSDSDDIPDSQIASQLKVLNADYRKTNMDVSKVPSPFQSVVADARIEFALAVRDPGGSVTSGVTRTRTSVAEFSLEREDVKFTSAGGHDAWPRDRYLNIWVAPKIRSRIGLLLGYAQFPDGPAESDGVAIATTAFGEGGTAQAPYDRGRTATHEVGHWLNLLHIWGEDNGGCDSSDNVADTPNQARQNYGCPTFPQVSCDNGPHGDMFMNYMDYADDKCMCMFSAGQVERMWATLEGPRLQLLSSNAHLPAGVTPTRRSAAFRDIVAEELGKPPRKVFDGVEWVPADVE